MLVAVPMYQQFASRASSSYNEGDAYYCQCSFIPILHCSQQQLCANSNAYFPR